MWDHGVADTSSHQLSAPHQAHFDRPDVDIEWELYIELRVGDISLNYLLHFQGLEQIPSRSVGYILRILGQNPTEDDIVEMVMKVSLMIILLML